MIGQNKFKQYFDLYFKIPVLENDKIYKDILLFEKYFIYFLKNHENLEISLSSKAFKEFFYKLINEEKYFHLRKIINLLSDEYIIKLMNLFVDYELNNSSMKFFCYLYQNETKLTEVFNIILFKERIFNSFNFSTEYLIKNTIYKSNKLDYIRLRDKILKLIDFEYGSLINFLKDNGKFKQELFDFIFIYPQIIHKLFCINHKQNILKRIINEINLFENLLKISLKSKINLIKNTIKNIDQLLLELNNYQNNLLYLIESLEVLYQEYDEEKFEIIKEFIIEDFNNLFIFYYDHYVKFAEKFLKYHFYIDSKRTRNNNLKLIQEFSNILSKILEYLFEFFNFLLNKNFCTESLKNQVGFDCSSNIMNIISPNIYSFIAEKIFEQWLNENDFFIRVEKYFPEFIKTAIKLKILYQKNDKYETFAFYYDILEKYNKTDNNLYEIYENIALILSISFLFFLFW